MRMSSVIKSILLMASVYWHNSMPSYAPPVRIGNKSKSIIEQDMLIVEAEIRRKSRAMRAYRNGLKRDAGYYRANYESNNNRFVFLKTIEV